MSVELQSTPHHHSPLDLTAPKYDPDPAPSDDGSTDSMVDLSLAIGEYIIQAREQFETDYPKLAYRLDCSDKYDAARDPEGHVRSILVALMHHCYKYNLDFDEELSFATDCFGFDLA